MQSKHMEVRKTGVRSLMKGERADKKRSGILRSGRPAMWRKEARTQISVIQGRSVFIHGPAFVAGTAIPIDGGEVILCVGI